jgi:hypothetical protein
MKLIWALQQKGLNQLHSPFVYDMFYVSIQMAKDLGYTTVLYGSSDAIERLGEYVDETFTTNHIDYALYDDLKVYIWENRIDDYLILDGDVFLHSPLVFKNPNSFVWVDTIVKKQQNGYSKDCLDILNTFDITKQIPEWNSKTGISFSTGLVRMKGNNGLLQYYVESYKKLKKWFLENETILIEKNEELNSNKSLISHYLCEHLLQRIVEYYGLEFEVLENENSYYHWQGNDKFKNIDKWDCIRLITNKHKEEGGTIRDVYDSLVKDELIKPILFP